jgi:hypothetical protein
MWAQPNLEPWDFPASASWVLGLQAHNLITSLYSVFMSLFLFLILYSWTHSFSFFP